MGFDLDKKNILLKLDKSRKGSIDAPILELVNEINRLENYYTTSSCSGRILLLGQPSERKDAAERIFISHRQVKEEGISPYWQSSSYPVWFRMEPIILHVACRSLAAAQKLLHILQKTGLKRSGLISFEKKIVIESRGTENMATLLAKNNMLLVPTTAIPIILEEANNRLQRTHQHIEEIKKEVKKI